jgi:7-cyano-7-deazaguanine synthase in queuosine biosynthesis
MKSDILLYSGGMDSYIAWHYLGKPRTLFVDLGHRYRVKEVRAIRDTIPDTEIIPSLFIGQYEEDDANIPMRNLLLVMCAVWEGANRVWLIVQKDEMSIPDRSSIFLTTVGKFLGNLVSRSVFVATPFAEMDKTDMVKWYMENVGDVDFLLRTVGCFDSGVGHCGNCGSCFRRYVALKNNGIDPGYELRSEIKSYYRTRRSHYSIERWERMEKWLI